MLANSLPTLLMLVGIPGSGKSSWLEKIGKIKTIDNYTYILMDNKPYAIICPDAIRQQMGSIQNQDQNAVVWHLAKDRAKDCLQRNMNVILDATNVNTLFRLQFIEGLPPCQKIAKVFYVNPEQACLRIKKDIENHKDRANVPDYAVYKMYGEFLYTIKVLTTEGFELYKE